MTPQQISRGNVQGRRTSLSMGKGFLIFSGSCGQWWLPEDVEHPAEGVRYLRSLGWPDDVCEAVLGHAHYTGVARTTRMAQALFAVDELTGLITASALVKPSKAVADVDVAGVRKKMKDKGFARGVNRDDIIQGAEALGVPLDEHIAIVLVAMQEIAGVLGLAGVGNGAGTGNPHSTTVAGDAYP